MYHPAWRLVEALCLLAAAICLAVFFGHFLAKVYALVSLVAALTLFGAGISQLRQRSREEET